MHMLLHALHHSTQLHRQHGHWMIPLLFILSISGSDAHRMVVTAKQDRAGQDSTGQETNRHRQKDRG